MLVMKDIYETNGVAQGFYISFDAIIVHTHPSFQFMI